jgi:hypothetical protein
MTTNHELVEQIEQLVRNHLVATRTAAAAALERAFATGPQGGDRPITGAARPAGRTRSMAPKRAREELVALGEQFYAVLCRHPGETMTALAAQVGASPGDRRDVVRCARLVGAGSRTRCSATSPSPESSPAGPGARACSKHEERGDRHRALYAGAKMRVHGQPRYWLRLASVTLALRLRHVARWRPK